jgi:uncharacterized protein
MIKFETPVGTARVRVTKGTPGSGLLVLGHGAGGGIDAPDLIAAAEAGTAREMSVALVEQPYRVAGRRSPAPARQLDQAWLAVVAALGGSGDRRGGPLIVGGRSSGARVACRTALLTGAAGVLCLAFPLHPPGKADDPSKSRQPELDGAGVPVLVVQGERDPFGRPSRDMKLDREVVVVPGTHSLPGKDAVGEVVSLWLARF